MLTVTSEVLIVAVIILLAAKGGFVFYMTQRIRADYFAVMKIGCCNK